MKQNRHRAILELISGEPIATQERLTERLREMRLPVTQATISRDIRELGLYKITDPATGAYRYAAPDSPAPSRLNAIFRDSALSCDFAQNLVIIKTIPGLAGAAGAALDAARNNEIVGTISGDDTVFVALRTLSAARELSADIARMIKN